MFAVGVAMTIGGPACEVATSSALILRSAAQRRVSKDVRLIDSMLALHLPVNYFFASA